MLLRLGILALCSIPAAECADWITFQDPIEHAFTLEVPKGWTVKGGLFRLGYSDYRPMVDLNSPDGKADIRFGDVGIPTYFLPNRLHDQEGSTVDLGAQAQLTVARYRQGNEYAALYARVRFREACPALTPEPVTGPAPISATPEEASVKQSSIGEASYVCGGTRTAYVYARTARYEAFWQVHTLASFVAPREQAAAARAIVGRCAMSFKFTDSFIQAQKRLDEEALVYQRERQEARRRALAQQVAQFEMRMLAMQGQVAAFERGQARQSGQAESWGNILTGLTPTTDPLGNPRSVWTGSKDGYWIDGKGNVLNSNSSPGPGWQRLKITQ